MSNYLNNDEPTVTTGTDIEGGLLGALRERLRETVYPKAAKTINRAEAIGKAAGPEIQAVAEGWAKVALSDKPKGNLQEKKTDYILEITLALANAEAK